MSDSGRGSPTGNDRRTPKVGVYVPRHRRQNNEESTEPNASGSSLSTSTPASTSRNNTSSRNQRESDSTKTSSSDVQRRGRGTFKGPAGSGTGNSDTSTRSKGGRDSTSSNNRNTRDGGRNGPSSQSVTGDATTAEPSPPRHTPRGRDFDATVLRRYSDDESRPNSSFSRSSSYSSSNNGGTLSLSTSSDYSRASDKSRSRPSQADTRPRRVDRSWRRDQESEEESQLSKQLERVQLNDESGGSSAAGSSNENKKEGEESAGDDEEEEEVEEWELALDNSDEDSVPKAPVPKSKPKSKAPAPSKIGNWSDVINDDMHILELYDFSSSIRTVHLTDMFAPYENRTGGFRIKWLDDTRALVIFESAAIAKQAYTANLSCQIARIRPYAGADKDAIRNEGRSSSAFNAPRPQKTDSVAKRLVHGALGLRVRRTPEQIAEEKALVKAAKEAREAQRQEQQRQRQEMDAVFNS
ncbi:hypothetical protein BG006_000311 [Podila minutissima]|uniref:Thc1 RRM domain-containing protein n=1 Tax=Podila minutissima TaxID=64525 RepID=A0A9P5SFF7_9FUNG|nr:hypothetical protein BG006_000311 [Podila minutissima]